MHARLHCMRLLGAYSDDLRTHGADACRLGFFIPAWIAGFPTLGGAQIAGFWRFASKTHPGRFSAVPIVVAWFISSKVGEAIPRASSPVAF